MGLWEIILPEAATNEVENPSFETGTTGWAASGSNTIAQSSSQSFRGVYSLLCTYQDDTDLATYALSGLTASVRYYAQCRVYVPSNWNGGNIRLRLSNFSGGSETIDAIWTSGTDPTGEWFFIETYIDLSSDVAGDLIIQTTSAPSAGRTIYVDVVMLEQNDSHYTTYCDGDMDGCYWNTEAHNSISVRDKSVRSGGVAVDLSDYGYKVVKVEGIGMPPVQQRTQKRSFVEGALYLGTKATPRSIFLTGKIAPTGSTGLAKIADLHSKRADVINAVKPDLVKEGQPFVLRYSGANSNNPVQIECVYDNGLEYGQLEGFVETVPLRAIAYDPYFQEVRQGAVILDLYDNLAYYRVISRVNGQYSNMTNGMDDNVYALAVDQNHDIYAGGAFTTAGGSTRYRIAFWDGSSWSAVGAGLDDVVRTLAIDAQNRAWIGGDFTDVQGGGGGTYNYTILWNGSSYTALGTGTNDVVRALALAPEGTLYVGGDFTTAGGVTVNYIAQYQNYTTWADLGSGPGLNGAVRAIVVDDNGDIYIGGDFTDVSGGGGGTYNRIIKYTPSTDTFSALGTGMNGSVYSLVIGKDGLLYAGGAFTTAGGMTVNYVAKWNGISWSALGSGMPASVNSLAFDGNGLLHLGGTGLVYNASLVIWNGSSYVPTDVKHDTTIYTIVFDDLDMYVGGTALDNFTVAHLNTVTNLGKARTYPILTLERSGGSSNPRLYQLKNWTTGDTISFDYTVSDGEKITMDFTPGGKKIISNLYGDITRGVVGGFNDGAFSLLPGENTVGTILDDNGYILGYMTWPIRHWSADVP